MVENALQRERNTFRRGVAFRGNLIHGLIMGREQRLPITQRTAEVHLFPPFGNTGYSTTTGGESSCNMLHPGSLTLQNQFLSWNRSYGQIE